MDDDSPRAPEPQAVVFTLGSSIDELINATFWRATELGSEQVTVVDAHRVNVYYPTDGSMVTVHLSVRPGMWGGIQQGPLEPETAAAADQKFSDALAASTPPPPPEIIPEQNK